jgi:hypothetical protein
VPRFKVVEERGFESRYLIDAESEEDARNYKGDIVAEERDADDYGIEVKSVEQVDDEEEL